MEGEFLRLLEFSLELVTPFDFHQYLTGILSTLFPETFTKHSDELSLYIIRQAIESHSEFLQIYAPSILACAAVQASVLILT